MKLSDYVFPCKPNYSAWHTKCHHAGTNWVVATNGIVMVASTTAALEDGFASRPDAIDNTIRLFRRFADLDFDVIDLNRLRAFTYTSNPLFSIEEECDECDGTGYVCCGTCDGRGYLVCNLDCEHDCTDCDGKPSKVKCAFCVRGRIPNAKRALRQVEPADIIGLRGAPVNASLLKFVLGAIPDAVGLYAQQPNVHVFAGQGVVVVVAGLHKSSAIAREFPLALS